MIKCPNPECGHENVNGTQYCEICGEELAAEKSTETESAGDTVFCPKCHAPNAADNAICEACGEDLPTAANAANTESDEAEADSTDDSTDSVNTDTSDAEEETAPESEEEKVEEDSATEPEPAGPKLEIGQVKLSVEQGMSVGKQFILGDTEMLVGREDEDEDIYPDIDLEDQDEGYVHRRHAMLKFEDGVLSVTHLGGGNKTRINNRPIPDDEPQPLKLGDKISFGKVVLRVLPNN